MQRPERIKIKNESGKLQSLPEGARYFQDLGGSGDILFLGLGPSPEKAADLLPEKSRLYYIENPAFLSQVPQTYSIPEVFKKIEPEQLKHGIPYRVIIYTPNKRLFPSFWEPLISRLAITKSGVTSAQRQKSVWIPGDKYSLMVPELCRAFASAGFTYRVIAPDAMRKNLLSLLAEELPEIMLSINFNGLDNSGETYFMLREAGIKTAVWIVDNPFHIISGIKSEYWKEVPLMVTDNWFTGRLKELGAQKVIHLPLATDPEIFNPDVSRLPSLDNRIVFVGRSSFPGKDDFFAGCRFSTEDEQTAIKAIQDGIKPDFEWWLQKSELQALWPGLKIRETGFKTEQSGLLWRITSLRKAGKQLTLFGDEGWRRFLPNADLRTPVDYYTELPSIYAGSGITLNMTSPLLPHGLTQRNFDVWAAGGFLLSDFTPGMSIFPQDLVEECTFSSPDTLETALENIFGRTGKNSELSKFWRNVILEHHTYRNRVDNILNSIQ